MGNGQNIYPCGKMNINAVQNLKIDILLCCGNRLINGRSLFAVYYLKPIYHFRYTIIGQGRIIKIFLGFRDWHRSRLYVPEPSGEDYSDCV